MIENKMKMYWKDADHVAALGRRLERRARAELARPKRREKSDLELRFESQRLQRAAAQIRYELRRRTR